MNKKRKVLDDFILQLIFGKPVRTISKNVNKIIENRKNIEIERRERLPNNHFPNYIISPNLFKKRLEEDEVGIPKTNQWATIQDGEDRFVARVVGVIPKRHCSLEYYFPYKSTYRGQDLRTIQFIKSSPPKSLLEYISYVDGQWGKMNSWIDFIEGNSIESLQENQIPLVFEISKTHIDFRRKFNLPLRLPEKPQKVVEGITEQKTSFKKIEIVFDCFDFDREYHYPPPPKCIFSPIVDPF